MRRRVLKIVFVLIAFLVILTLSLKNLFATFDMLDENIARQIDFKNTCLEQIDIINDPSYTEGCIEAWNSPNPEKYSFYVTFFNGFVIPFHSMNMYMFLVLIIPVSFLVCSKLKHNYLKNYLTRSTFKDFKKNLFKDAFSSIWIFPTVIVIVFVLCAFYTNNYTAGGELIPWSENSTANVIAFCILYLLNVTLYSITYINIFLIAARKNHKTIVAIIVSILLFLGIELFLEIFINSFIFIRIFHSGFGLMFNIMNSITFNEQYGVIVTILFGIFWCVLSSILVKKLYKNQEKLLMDCEKNVNRGDKDASHN